MFQYYQPHPKGISTNDCVKRAIVVVTGMDYMEVQRQLNQYKKVSGAKQFNSIKNLRYVEDKLHAKTILLEKPITAAEFCQNHPHGRYILDIQEHWSSCVNGTLYDTWDCSNELVRLAYEVSTLPYTPPNLKQQVFKHCCTSERISDTETRIRIYDGLGNFAERTIPTPLTEGYVRCLIDNHYCYVAL